MPIGDTYNLFNSINYDRESILNQIKYCSTVIPKTYPQNDMTSIVKTVAENWDVIEKKIEEEKDIKEQSNLKVTQRRNRALRNRVKHVHWSGNTCIMYWNDGTQTKARWDLAEDFDPEKAMLTCIARKYYGDTGIYNEVLRKYEQDGWDHFEKHYMIPEKEYDDDIFESSRMFWGD